MDDVDIYGDLCGDLPKPKLAPSPASQPSVPAPARPAATDPRQDRAPAGDGERPFRARARNLVWKAPGLEAVKEAQVPQSKETEPEVVEVLDDDLPPQPAANTDSAPAAPATAAATAAPTASATAPATAPATAAAPATAPAAALDTVPATAPAAAPVLATVPEAATAASVAEVPEPKPKPQDFAALQKELQEEEAR